jgi:hypothetical protein
MHGWNERSPKCFQVMCNHGHAIFHKETNTFGGSGDRLKHGFMKLDKSHQTADKSLEQTDSSMVPVSFKVSVL